MNDMNEKIENRSGDIPQPQESTENKEEDKKQPNNQNIRNEGDGGKQININAGEIKKINIDLEPEKKFKDPTKPFTLDTNNILEFDEPILDGCCKELEENGILIVTSFDIEVLSAFPHNLIEKSNLTLSEKRILFFKGDNLKRNDLSIEILVAGKIGSGDQTLIITQIFDNGAQYFIDSILQIDTPNHKIEIKNSLKAKKRMILLLFERKLFLKTFKENTKDLPFPHIYLDKQDKKPNEQLEPKSFNTWKSKIENAFVDTGNRLWTTDGEQVKIFHVKSKDPIVSWPLMQRNWKIFFNLPLCNSFFCADWDGSLYAFNEETREKGQILREAKYNDLPVHCIAGNENGQLAVGTWGGKIILDNSLENTTAEAISPVIPCLPTHLLLLSTGFAIAADQAGCVHLLDCKGKQEVIMKSQSVIKDMWAYEEQAGDFILLLLENKRIVEIKIRGNKINPISLYGEVSAFSHRGKNAQDKWTALVMKGGAIDWFSWNARRIVTNNRVKLKYEIRQFIALYDPQQPTALIGIGLTEKGEFFSLNGNEAKIYPSPSIEKVLVTDDGRFVYWLFKDRIEWLRNPVFLPIPCKIEKISQAGALVCDEYKEIRLAFKNTGAAPINKIKAQIKGQDRITEEWVEKKDIELFPGKTIELSFSVRAIAVGTLNLDLQIEMEDEAGPPSWPHTISLRVESMEK